MLKQKIMMFCYHAILPYPAVYVLIMHFMAYFCLFVITISSGACQAGTLGADNTKGCWYPNQS